MFYFLNYNCIIIFISRCCYDNQYDLLFMVFIILLVLKLKESTYCYNILFFETFRLRLC